MITTGTQVIDKRTRRTGTVVAVLDYSNAFRYRRNSLKPRAEVRWRNGRQTRVLLSTLTVADETTLAENRAKIQADRIAAWRGWVKDADEGAAVFAARGDVTHAAHQRKRAEIYRQKLREAGVDA